MILITDSAFPYMILIMLWFSLHNPDNDKSNSQLLSICVSREYDVLIKNEGGRKNADS